MKQLSLSLALTLALAACGPTAQQAPAPEAASDQPAEAVPPKAADALAEDALANVLAGSWRSAGDNVAIMDAPAGKPAPRLSAFQ